MKGACLFFYINREVNKYAKNNYNEVEMPFKPITKLNPKKHYLQIALNSTLDEAHAIITQLPRSDRILLEAGTPLIKRYGEEGIRKIRYWYEQHLLGQDTIASSSPRPSSYSLLPLLIKLMLGRGVKPPEQNKSPFAAGPIMPYVVADLKMMDRGEAEVEIAARGGASAAVALGAAPIESLDAFIENCENFGLDAMIDMMNVEYPLGVLRKLKKPPPVVILHRGVDEEHFNKEKQIPLHEIHRIKGNYNIMISIAGGDTIREVQRSIFNDADIVVVWKSFFQSAADTAKLAEQFLKEIK